MSSSKSSLLKSLVDHVALPPRLPGKQESNIDEVEHALTSRLLDASRILRDLTDSESSHQWECICNILHVCKVLNAGGKLTKASLLTQFGRLEGKDIIILHVAEQNAGLLIRRQHDIRDDVVIFEAFEAAPLSEKVLSAENALQWDFPGYAVAIPYTEFANDSFQDTLAGFLEQASTESIKRFAAHSNKAGSSVIESRDTVDPSLITQMLMTLLEVNGCRISPPLLRKRVRDDVCLTDGAEKPWRRSAYWLVLRVGVERHLCTLHGGEAGRVYYKVLTCLVLGRLLEDTLDHLSPELLTLLKAKLSRRLVKLQLDKEKTSPTVRSIYEFVFVTLGPLLHDATRSANERIGRVWESFKATIRRRVQPLPRRANDSHLVLKLPTSRAYLDQVLSTHLHTKKQKGDFEAYRSSRNYELSSAIAKPYLTFASRYLSLSDSEAEIEAALVTTRNSTNDDEKVCTELATRIDEYLCAVADGYDTNPEQKSSMLLTVMELWVSMDWRATKLFGLLKDYDPGFPPEILDVLQLPRLKDMRRLQEIQLYLENRYAECKSYGRTIFDDPGKGCFAERYFNESNDKDLLLGLSKSIEEAAESSRQRKEKEWRKLSKQFEKLQKEIAESDCQYKKDDNDMTVHDHVRCRKCYLQRQAKRMKINVHEHPLPTDPVQATVVVFELGCPEAFLIYRNATWKILHSLAHPKQVKGDKNWLLLREYRQLRAFVRSKTSGISLASTTKSFLETHYNGIRLPVELDRVCLPNGLKLRYFDTITSSWSGQAQKPTFAHHLQTVIPLDSPFRSLQGSPNFAVDSNGPSSYEIIASQTECPAGLNVHEFMAYQALYSGKHRRWITMLVELGSSSLNFSTEAAALTVSQLALQAGPALASDPLRAIHGIFRDETFCRRLIEQIDQHLDGITSNWLEVNCMDMLLTLTLRLWSLGPEHLLADALKLLLKARAITFKWMSHLRLELRKSTDASTSQRCSSSALGAALLCRRTFAILTEGVDAGRVEILEPTALCCFIECSIVMQDNLVGNPTNLPHILKSTLIRDLKMVHRMRFVLRMSLEASLVSMRCAIENFWPQPEGEVSKFSAKPKFLDGPNEWWIQLTADATEGAKQQTLHYHLLEGHLLVDGKALGKLPTEHRDSGVIEQLFGKQRLPTYPSGLYGMTDMLAYNISGHQIHFGLRDGRLIVQACVSGTILELVPREMFGDSTNFDLPASLVRNCSHWLDLQTGIMEIRRSPEIWTSKWSFWRLDCQSRMARRRNSFLVDPYSPLFQSVARIFDNFEYPVHLTVYQPPTGTLAVDLLRLELSFCVNAKNLLECRQLRSEVDLDQDAGTWYGLNSKLVLRDVTNSQQRSIITPMGRLRCIRDRFHVAVNISNDGGYSRFTINEILGRLDCPAEPRLLYLKAQFHAVTSFVVSDPLTGRTGTEEALHCLRSGICQPWTPLNDGPCQVLVSIASLTPKREYYPKHIKVVQSVRWDNQLTTTIQHEAFRSVVGVIWKKSKELSVFALEKTDMPSLESTEDAAYLVHRSSFRRSLYERPAPGATNQQAAPDVKYETRDQCPPCQARQNVFECVTLLRDWSPNMPTTPDLAGVLQTWPSIGGYDRSFDKFLLSDRLDVDFAAEWGALTNLCCSSDRASLYPLLFLFVAISFRCDVDMDIVRTLIAFTISEDLKVLDTPKWPTYTYFRQNQAPNVDYLVQLIKPCCIPYQGDERSSLQIVLSSQMRRKLEAAELKHKNQTAEDCKSFARCLLEQWPCPEPKFDEFLKPLLIDMSEALIIIRPEWLRLFQNMELAQHIQKAQRILDRHRVLRKIKLPEPCSEGKEIFPTRYRGGELLTLHKHLMLKTGPIKLRELSPNVSDGSGKCASIFTAPKEKIPRGSPKAILANNENLSISPEMQQLKRIIEGIANTQSVVQQRYGEDLMQSLSALKTIKSMPTEVEDSILPVKLNEEISKARQAVQDRFEALSMAFENDDLCARWLKEGGLWPCITPVTILEQLRSTLATTFGDGMKAGILEYATSITTLQRFLRMKDAHLSGNTQRMREEQKNLGHANWRPLIHSDWLLLEIDANILIRRDQVNVALATISPKSGSNSVLQMNMGQGKTSCVMPMVAAVLADTKKLLRVVIPKPLLLQTAQLLQARLGNLVGRELKHLPFSRKTPTDSKTIESFFNIQKDIRASSGVIVALPEHILSFMLSGLQRLSDKRIAEATQILKVQAWTREVCRDVLDECDFTLAVRTQLIYPSGAQSTVDGHPHRWETAEAILHLVECHLWSLQDDFAESIKVVTRPQGGFPMISFLRKDVEDALLARVVNDILYDQASIIPTRECTESDRLAIKHFISDAVVRPAIAARIPEMFPERRAVKQNIYLLRGLLVHRLLLLTLKKRWNVEYGLHPHRDPIAVPFHAKGVPSEQAEWGHPDVAILFTCLAFYYGGLDLAQLRQSLENVMKSDDPSAVYDRWTHGSSSLPDSLREWKAINVDDEAQLVEIWQHVRYNVAVIDYFLNQLVFPKHAKQFQVKLQASGWDIPLFSTEPQPLAEQGFAQRSSQPLTTGFSGTNDNRTILPLTIKQDDLPGLSHISAEVLTYLLRPQSRTYVLAADKCGRRLSELDLLRQLKALNIRMLIDAGAQILEMDNLSLAREWLKVDHEAPAAVYFNADNKPVVLYRQGHEIPLLASPFATDLGDCLVYLDEAHTRGTDLKMPACARGALTLGLGQTKDHTVQAAMRLRQLATSQSVVFFAPPDVHQSILDLREKKSNGHVDSYDVIYWLLEQTCRGIEQMQPLYYSQGIDFCRRVQAALDNPDCIADIGQRNAYLGTLRQNEQQTLEQLYTPRLTPTSAESLGPFCDSLQAFKTELDTRRKGFPDLGGAAHDSALEEVEQEREVAYEVEAVREVQKPSRHAPLSFSRVHKDIITFAQNGILAAGPGGGYEHVFTAMKRTGLGSKYRISGEATTSKLFVSIEFTRTVSLPRGRQNDNFLRQVGWILWSMTTETALIITPEEAEFFIPLLRKVSASVTHLLTYAAPVTRKMLHFNDLRYYAVPALPIGWMPPTWLTIELGLYSGRLYFGFDEYKEVCKYFCVQEPRPKLSETSATAVLSSDLCGADGPAFDPADDAESNTNARQWQSFTARPLTFMQDWLTERRKGQDITNTPMGYLCQGKLLTASHPFFRGCNNDGGPSTHTDGVTTTTGRDESLDMTNESGPVSDDEVDENNRSSDEGGNVDGIFDESELSSGEHSAHVANA